MNQHRPNVVRMNALQWFTYGWWLYPLKDWLRFMAGPPKQN